ncbi:hypothetical protein GL2_03050 [Microbulbifer sp. GL-2]|nr:hypothetical protein GL2_03050 [Microbulbifer sp. GL-2]
MISELRLSILLRGEKFSPKEAENVTGLRLQAKLEVRYLRGGAIEVSLCPMVLLS